MKCETNQTGTNEPASESTQRVLDQPTHFRQGGPVVHRYQVHLALGRSRRQDRHRRRQEGHRRRGGR